MILWCTMIDTGPISPISFLVISLVILQFLINWIIPQTRFTFIFNMILFFEGISVFLLQSKVPIRFGILLTLTSGYFIFKSVRGRDNLSPSDTNIIYKFFSSLKQNFPLQFFFSLRWI